MSRIFTPKHQEHLQIKELDIHQIFEMISTRREKNDQITVYHTDEEHVMKEYVINIGSDRYALFKRNPKCSCCGLKATRCFLDQDAQNGGHHINFYAESCDVVKGNQHLVLLVKDHIKPRSSGGEDVFSNYQTLCYNCNSLKATHDLSIEEMQQLLFPAYRAFRSTIVLNAAKELTLPYRSKIERNKKTIEAITKALEIVHDDRVEGMREKLEKFKKENNILETACDEFEEDAQVLGVCSDDFQPQGFKDES